MKLTDCLNAHIYFQMKRKPSTDTPCNRPEITNKGNGFYLRAWLPGLSLYLLLSFINPVMASGSPVESKQEGTISFQTDNIENPEEEKNSTFETRLHKVDTLHATLSRSISSSADWIDSYFGDERSKIEEENSSLRLKLSGFAGSGEGTNFEVRASLHLVLPNLENRLHLFASSILEDDEKAIEYFDPDDDREDTRRNFYLSIRYFIKTAESMNLSLRGGLKFHSLTPALFTGPRYSYIKNWSSWAFRFIEEMTYFTDNGWESNCSFEFEKSFTETIFYRIKYSGRWQEDEPGYVYWIDNDLYNTISDNKVLGYRVRGFFDRYPGNQLTYVLAGMRYRQSFWRKWLFFEITPQVIFRKEKDYHPSPGITLSLGIFLGEDFMGNTVGTR